jgi:DNA-binding MarR family transcriptional regulator
MRQADCKIPEASQRMLTLQLRQLERDGLLTRTVNRESMIRTQYELTPYGRTLLPAFQPLVVTTTRDRDDGRRPFGYLSLILELARLIWPKVTGYQAALAAIVAFAHQTSSSRAVFADGSRMASMSWICFLPNIG